MHIQIKDVDFENNIIHVRRVAVMPIDAPIVKGTKTGVKRPVALCDILKNILLPFSKSIGYIVHDDKGRQFTKSRYKKFAKSLKEEVDCQTLTPESCAIHMRPTIMRRVLRTRRSPR